MKVEFFVRDQGARYDSLRMFANALMRDKLTQFDKLGVNVKEAHRTGGERTGAYFSLDRYTTYQSRAQSSLNSRCKGQVVNDVRRPNGFFCNKVPYGQFDSVLHAEITEPPVQYTYTLTLQCQLPEAPSRRAVKETIKYLLLTDKGDLKELKPGAVITPRWPARWPGASAHRPRGYRVPSRHRRGLAGNAATRPYRSPRRAARTRSTGC